MTGLAVLAVVYVCYSLVAARLERWSITAPMVFVVAGALIGPEGLGIFEVASNTEAVTLITELTLAIILFADASTLRWKEVRLDPSLPSRLLLIGFPLTVLAGAIVAGWLAPEVSWAAAALVGSILAPTDAALGLGVFSDRSVPARIDAPSTSRAASTMGSPLRWLRYSWRSWWPRSGLTRGIGSRRHSRSLAWPLSWRC